MEYSDEEMERMVEESKAIQRIVDFANSEGVAESVEKIVQALVIVATKFKRETDLSVEEIISALTGSITGVLALWAIEITRIEPADE